MNPKNYLFHAVVAALVLFVADHASAIQFYTNPAYSVTPTNLQWGQQGTYSLSVANTSGATQTFVLNVYLSNATTVNGASVLESYSNPTALPNNTFQPFNNITFTLPSSVPAGFSSGTNYLVATLSVGGVVQVSTSIALTLSPAAADLIGRQVQTTYQGNLYNFNFSVQQSTANWGQNVGFQFAVKNQGSSDTTGPFRVRFFLSETNNFGTGNTPRSSGIYEIVPASTISSLPSGYFAYSVDGSGNPGYFTFSLPSSNPFGDGTTFYIGMVINPSGDPAHPPITEFNYTNNCNQSLLVDSAAITIRPVNSTPQPSLAVFGSNPQGSNSQLDFGSVNADGPGSAVATQTITLTNTGNKILNVSNLSINSAGTSAGFKIASIVSSYQTLPNPPAWPKTMQMNSAEIWTATVTYDPTAASAQTGTLTIASDDPTTPTLNYALTGTGVAVPHLAFTNPIAYNNNSLIANFGNVLTNATLNQTLTLSNSGTQALTINQNGIALTDTQGGVWSITSITSSTQGTINLASAAKTIAANSAETWGVAVRFLPANGQGYATNLQIFSNDPLTVSGAPTISCLLQGQGQVPIPLTLASAISGVATPNPLVMNFGSAHATGQNKIPGTVTLTNTGTAALNIAQNGIALGSSTHFQISGITSNLQGTINLGTAGAAIAPNSGETWTISVAFAPTASGAQSTTLSITSADPGQSAITVALSGTGLNQPGISVTTPQGGTALPFGPVLNDGAGNHVGTQAFTIQNLGLQPLVISQNGLTLTNATGFAIQGITSSTQGTINLATGSKTVAANSAETWTVTVNLDPTGNAAYSGTLSVASNDPVTPSAALTLNGSGTTPTLTLNPATSTTPVLNIQAGQIYNITWSAGDTSDTAAAATLTLATAPTNAMPATGLTTIATIPFNPATTSYAWRPGASLVGQQVYVYGSLADTGVAANSFSAQKVQVEAAGSFSLLSPLVTAGTNYVYQYLYNGKVYAGTAALQAGNNLVSISTPMNGGGSVVHQISVTSTPSLLATQGYTYDEMNRVKTFTNGNGITTTNTYDFRGNLTQSSASNGNVVAYAYDALNRRTSMTDGTGTTFYDYDDMDRVTGITYSGDAIKGNSDDLLLSYGYDNASRVTSITYPGGQQVAYTFDNAGRMLTAKDVANNLTTTYFYNPTSGLLQTVTRPNGVLTTYGYNSAGLLNDIKHTKGSSTLAEYAYSLDSRGNATALLTTFSDGSKKQELYTYDGQQRLTQVVYGHNATAAVNQDKTVDYTYDGVGNRLTQKTTIGNAVTQTLTCSYGSENRLVQITDQTGAVVNSYVYDAAGNRIQKVTPAGATYYSYDERNLLTSVVTPADYITYTYNGAAQRVGKTVNGVTTKYIVDPSRSVFQNVQEWSGGAITKSYVYGDDRLECNPASASLQFYLPDRLGSVRIITDQNGNVTSTYNYDAFGAQQ